MTRRTHKAHRPLALVPYDSADHLKTEEEVSAYLEEAFREGADDPRFIAHALGVVARVRGMAKMSKETGISREGLYKALSKDGNPSFDTVNRVVRAIGLRIGVKPAHA